MGIAVALVNLNSKPAPKVKGKGKKNPKTFSKKGKHLVSSAGYDCELQLSFVLPEVEVIHDAVPAKKAKED